jgi:hypothetical protein
LKIITVESLGEEESGFRHERPCAVDAFTLKQPIHKRIKYNKHYVKEFNKVNQE